MRIRKGRHHDGMAQHGLAQHVAYGVRYCGLTERQDTGVDWELLLEMDDFLGNEMEKL
jgi:hypothetical protein